MCLSHAESSAESVFSLNDAALVTRSAVVVLTDEFFSGQTKALKILFTSERLTEEQRLESLRDDGRALRKKDHAYLVLFIDKDNRVWQVNLTVVIPGQTVVRTVAWKPEELRRFSADYSYDGRRLRLRSKGTSRDSDSEKAPVNLAWDVNVDAPVIDRLGLGKK